MAEQTNPSGCRHCGIDKHGHLSQWAPHPVGWHTWVEPTMEQRKAAIKANLGRFTGKKLDRTEQEPKPEPAGFCCGCCDDEPEPDWADLREMARGAGYQVHLRYGGTKARRKRYVPSWIWHVRDEHAAVVEFERTVAAYRVETRGTKGWTVLADPTPAEVLVAARLVGLGGAS